MTLNKDVGGAIGGLVDVDAVLAVDDDVIVSKLFFFIFIFIFIFFFCNVPC